MHTHTWTYDAHIRYISRVSLAYANGYKKFFLFLWILNFLNILLKKYISAATNLCWYIFEAILKKFYFNSKRSNMQNTEKWRSRDLFNKYIFRLKLFYKNSQYFTVENFAAIISFTVYGIRIYFLYWMMFSFLILLKILFFIQ